MEDKSLPKRNPYGIPRRDVREIFRKTSSDQGGLHKFTEKERVRLEKELFPLQKGSLISGPGVRGKIKELNKQLFNTKNDAEKFKIRDEINLLKELEKDV